MANNDRITKRIEREKEYIDAIEQVVGAPLFPYQKELLLEIRRATIEGRKINLSPAYVRARRNSV